jgi:hypothetical protein
MFSCAYEINLDISQVREELKHLNNPTFKCAGSDDMCFYVSDETVKKQSCDAIINFKNTFNNNFVDGIRFLNMHPGQKYLPHVDSNEQGFHKDIPMDIQHPGNVNILLSTPVGDTTVWYIDTELRKLWPWAFSNNGDLFPDNVNNYISADTMGKDKTTLQEVDRFKLTDKATLFNTSAHHTIVSEDVKEPRSSACFIFWPYNSWQGIVEAVKAKGVILER